MPKPTLPALIEACKKLVTGDRKAALQQRGARLAETYKRNHDQARRRLPSAGIPARFTPPAFQRSCGPQIKNEDWVGWSANDQFFGRLADALWNFDSLINISVARAGRRGIRPRRRGGRCAGPQFR